MKTTLQNAAPWLRRVELEQRLWSEWKANPELVPAINTILSHNKKTGYSINLPLLTCIVRLCGLCMLLCYAARGPIAWPQHVQLCLARFWLWKHDRERWMRILLAEVRRKRLTHLRLAGSGEVPEAMVRELAEALPGVRLFLYTRDEHKAGRLASVPNVSVNLSCDEKHDVAPIPGVRTCYLKTSAKPAPSHAAVVFPVHPSLVGDPRDCGCDAGTIPTKGACQQCKRCL